MFNKKIYTKGFSLIEVIIFTTIFSVFFFGFFNATYSFYETDLKLFQDIQKIYEE